MYIYIYCVLSLSLSLYIYIYIYINTSQYKAVGRDIMLYQLSRQRGPISLKNASTGFIKFRIHSNHIYLNRQCFKTV